MARRGPRVNPYNYDPLFTEEELINMEIQEENIINENENLLKLVDIVDNCSCSKCVPEWIKTETDDETEANLKRYINNMDLRSGVICCQQINAVKRFLRVEEPVNTPICITNFHSFEPVILNRMVLATNYRCHLHDRRLPAPPRILSNKTYRYSAYRAFNHMIYNILGKRNRRVVPICTLLDIRRRYPEERVDLYSGYKPVPEAVLAWD